MNKLKNSFLVITAALFILGGCKDEVEKTFGIELSQNDLYGFLPPVKAGSNYTVTPLTITVTNKGNQATGALQIELSGAAADKFELSDDNASAGIAAGQKATFKVAPKLELSEGIYNATVTVKGSANITAQSFDVRFEVTEGDLFRIGLSVNDIYQFDPVHEGSGYTVESLEVTVTNTGNQPTGALTVALSGAKASNFELSPTTIASINLAGTDKFLIKTKQDLAEGEYKATVTVSGNTNIEPQSFEVEFVVLEKLEINYRFKNEPRTTYGINEPVDLSDLQIEASTGSGPWVDVDPSAISLGTYDFSSAGSKKVQVKVESVTVLELNITVKSLAGRIADAAGKTAIITLYANESVDATITIPSSTDITLTTADNTERVINKATNPGNLFIIGSNDRNNTVKDSKLTVSGYVTMKGLSTSEYGGTDQLNNNTYLVHVGPGGVLTMKGHSKVSGNTNFEGVTPDQNPAMANIGTTNTATVGGGIGVHNAVQSNTSPSCSSRGGTLYLTENSEVSNNNFVNIKGGYAVAGGVFATNFGTVYLKDNAKITKNQVISNTYAWGGGFWHNYYSVFYMTGGEISENIADGGTQASGGGLHLQEGSARFFMSGGVIKDNVLKFVTAGRGSAITIENPLTVVLSGDAIIRSGKDAFNETTVDGKKSDSRNSIAVAGSGRVNIKGTLSTTVPIILDVTGWTFTNPLLRNNTVEYAWQTCPGVNTDNPLSVNFTNAPIDNFELGRQYNLTTGAITLMLSDTKVLATSGIIVDK